MKDFKSTLTAFFIVTFGLPALGLAHDQSGFLDTGASATDLYQVSCFDDGGGAANKLSFEIKGESKLVLTPVSAQVLKDDLSMSTTDHVSGDQFYGPGLTLVGGNGTYLVLVDKSGLGKVKYSFEYHCESSSGAHTGTDISQVQDQ